MKTDLLNQRFGKLVVLSAAPKPSEVKSRGAYWLCKCDCGTEKVIRGRLLVEKQVIACGCVWKSKRHQEMRGEYLSNLAMNAKRRGIPFSVTNEYLWNLYEQQDRRCALTGLQISFDKRGQQTCSLDRIDSGKPYEEGNLQWVHKDLNRMKTDLSLERFIELCKLVANLS